MEQRREGDEATPEESADDELSALMDDDEVQSQGDEPDVEPDADDALGGLEDFEVHSEPDADALGGRDSDADEAPELDSDAHAEEPASAKSNVASNAVEKSKGLIKSILSGAFMTNDLLRIAAVVATVVGVVLAAIGLWKLLYSEPMVPEGLDEPTVDASAAEEDWTDFDSTSDATASEEDWTIPEEPIAQPEPEPEPEVPPAPAVVAAPKPTPPPPKATPAPAPTRQMAPITKQEPEPEPTPRRPSTGPDPWARYLNPSPSGSASAGKVKIDAVAPLVPELSAYEQLMRSREAPATSPESSDMNAVVRESIARALHDAGAEFVRFLVEDAASIPTLVGRSEWASLKDSNAYTLTMYNIYDHILSVDDKLALFSAYTQGHPRPASAPQDLTAIAAPNLDDLRAALWQKHGPDVELFVSTAQ